MALYRVASLHFMAALKSVWKEIIILRVKLKANVSMNNIFVLQYYRKPAGRFQEDDLTWRAQLLATQLKSTESEMYKFLSSNKKLVNMGKEKFQRLTELLGQNGITKKEIFTSPDIYHKKYETIENRIKQLKEGGIKPITLRMVNTTQFKYFFRYKRLTVEAEAYQQYKSSAGALSVFLGISESEAQSIISESILLQNTRLSTLIEKLELLQAYGISKEAIRERLWVVAKSTLIMKSRLETLKQLGITFQDFPSISLTALGIADTQFKKYCDRLLKEKTILQHVNCTSKEEYICHRLNCSVIELEEMIKKFPALLSINLPKLKTNLDIFLNECSVPPSKIIHTPRVLGFSTVTLHERVQKLKTHNIELSCTVLTLTKPKFKKIFEQFI